MKTRQLTTTEIIDCLIEDKKLSDAFADWIAASVVFGSPERRLSTLVDVFNLRASALNDRMIECDDGECWEAG
jgi:uncharacterized protein with PhoU and TrkA domain